MRTIALRAMMGVQMLHRVASTVMRTARHDGTTMTTSWPSVRAVIPCEINPPNGNDGEPHGIRYGLRRQPPEQEPLPAGDRGCRHSDEEPADRARAQVGSDLRASIHNASPNGKRRVVSRKSAATANAPPAPRIRPYRGHESSRWWVKMNAPSSASAFAGASDKSLEAATKKARGEAIDEGEKRRPTSRDDHHRQQRGCREDGEQLEQRASSTGSRTAGRPRRRPPWPGSQPDSFGSAACRGTQERLGDRTP